jgi:hypothetical protein
MVTIKEKLACGAKVDSIRRWEVLIPGYLA